ncbi:MAG: APC family permease [Bacteroidales bacterium]
MSPETPSSAAVDASAPAADANAGSATRGRVRVVVATTVFLSFISFWRAAAIVLADLGSSAFYAGGIAEEAVGKAAPWFILGVMLFSYAVRAIYIESSVMFVRGGVYRVVKEALGGTLAKLSVSALLFDYVLTGPISAVSAGQYIVGLLNDVARGLGWHAALPRNETAAVLAGVVIIYFWWRNTQGLRESSSDALHIVQVTTVMVVVLLAWGAFTLLVHGGQPAPAPTVSNLHFSKESLGWLRGTVLPSITAIAVLVGLGHAFLAMSGWESLAQVYREIEHPKPANLRRAATVIFFYSVIFTASVSFLAVALIPDTVRPHFYDNLIAGLAMHLAGPHTMRLLFQGVVVVVGFLILAGAVNTAIVGSNAVVNRVSEDGVLTEWFRRPHKKYGTTYRILNTIVGLQLATLILSRGDVYLLGEAYAFGVVWSFALKSRAVLVLRFKEPGPREWRVGGNVRIGRVELPIGLALITLALFAIALTNLFTKELATISGVGFTLVLYGLFVFSERHARASHAPGQARGLDQFQLERADDIALGEVAARPGNVLVPVRDYNTLKHLAWALDHVNTEKRDIVVMTVRLLQGPDAPFRNIEEEQLFLDYEQLLFTRVVAVAERHGKPVKLLVVPSINVFDAVAQSAVRLASAEIVVGESAKIAVEEQARLLGEAWERTAGSDKVRTRLVAYRLNGDVQTFMLGPHLPPLTTEDLELIHQLWLQTIGPIGLRLHHRDVVRAALEDFRRRLTGPDRDQVIREIREQVQRAGKADQ